MPFQESVSPNKRSFDLLLLWQKVLILNGQIPTFAFDPHGGAILMFRCSNLDTPKLRCFASQLCPMPNLDQISLGICNQLNQGNQLWTWGAHLGGQKNWSRIFKHSWLRYAQAGHFRRAVHEGEPMRESYPLVWFELKSSQDDQPHGPFDLFVPISTNGYSRAARGDVYDNFLNALFQASLGTWPEVNEAVIQYLADIRHEYIGAHPVHIPALDPFPIVMNYINYHFTIIDNAFEALH